MEKTSKCGQRARLSGAVVTEEEAGVRRGGSGRRKKVEFCRVESRGKGRRGRSERE